MIEIFPVFETAPVASRTDEMSIPLVTIMSLKAELELPLIVLIPAPLKLTDAVPVPALKVPLFVKSPLTSRLMLLLISSSPLIVSFPEAAAASTVTIVPAPMVTSSPAPGMPAPPHVAALFHKPVCVLVNVAKYP